MYGWLIVFIVGLVYYMVFRHDFGEKAHCFTKVLCGVCVWLMLSSLYIYRYGVGETGDGRTSLV